MSFALLAATAAVMMASSPDALSADQLVEKAKGVLANREGPPNGTVLGTFHGAPVVVMVKCGDVCPAYTVRVIHFVVPDGKNCAKLGGMDMSVMVPMGISIGPQAFCIPDPLIKKDLWQDRPYRNAT